MRRKNGLNARSAFMIGITVVLVMTRAACSSFVPETSNPPPPPAQAFPSPSPSTSPALHSSLASPAQPSSVAVVFSGLPAGTYPVHLHSRCAGSQGFHIIALASLHVVSSGSGSISVSRSYFGRGLCLIVYASRSLTALVTTRPI